MKTSSVIDLLTANMVEIDTLLAPINFKLNAHIPLTPQEFVQWNRLSNAKGKLQEDLDAAWQSLAITKKKSLIKTLLRIN